jgi:hypothetical protein
MSKETRHLPFDDHESRFFAVKIIKHFDEQRIYKNNLWWWIILQMLSIAQNPLNIIYEIEKILGEKGGTIDE